ncbi:Hsp20/alpha crystallin family protein [Streptomyces antimicrobicus]|uniref:Hsp20/alpha crystallin family protein n=1 Tax=Streptomyces antimicrobicus TaxID=2883108 RepID=A0ABS8BBF0_9ACTN|nr:Hsp20/alpha crystallin family protein [Streptomyces antimicrobicus]MCB5181935.1 Hsp20/alpha crystallin family protein [Streptomyces antimicrobicus]
MALPIRRGGALSERLRPSWDPFREFENMWGEMGRLLEQAAVPATAGGQWLPMAEEEETDDAYVVRMELPGVPAENVDIEVGDNELSISGEVSEEHRGKVLSRRTGKFSYRTSLPGMVDASRCDADLSEGLLTVRIPKTTESRRRKVELKSAGARGLGAAEEPRAGEGGHGAQAAPMQGMQGSEGMHGSAGA